MVRITLDSGTIPKIYEKPHSTVICHHGSTCGRGSLGQPNQSQNFNGNTVFPESLRIIQSTHIALETKEATILMMKMIQETLSTMMKEKKIPME
jgi:hypothetical protein